MVICDLCEQPFTDDEILDHLANTHDQDINPLLWPDGDPVIVDHTLTPEDFG